MEKSLLIRIPLILIAVTGIILVRKFQSSLFYDPFLLYFEKDFQHLELPDYQPLAMYLSLAGRYFLNAAFTLLLLYGLFPYRKTIVNSGLVLLIGGCILFILYILLVENKFPFGYLSVFYVRRFLLQPIWLFLLIPFFFYMENKSKENPESE